jgi:perosamine synthetase
MRVPYARPSIGQAEVDLVLDAVAHGWGSDRDRHIELFQSEFASFVGSEYAIATSSCTGALHLGLAALGIGPGDEVILADTNWIATLAPIVHLGATPVLVDIKSDIWCIDPDHVSAAITPRTKVVIATHLYGNVADIEDLQTICEDYDLWLAEDAAEGIGSRYGMRHVGSMGDFGVFSFHGSKTITTGEGGMFVTNNPELFEQVLTLSNHGRSRAEKRMFWPERIGFKFKMSNLQAALGLAQLRRVEGMIREKQHTLKTYASRLENDRVHFNPVQPGRISGGWMPTLSLSEANPRVAEVIASLRGCGVDARPVFAPLTSIRPGSGRVGLQADYFFRRALNLPSPLSMTEEEVAWVVENVSRLLRQHRLK